MRDLYGGSAGVYQLYGALIDAAVAAYADGVVGTTGPQGPQGVDGVAGPQGAIGPQGAAGAGTASLNPLITIVGGGENMEISQNKATTYTDGGATAVSASGTDITSSITTTGGVSSSPGVYTISYNVIDEWGRSSVKDRKVRVV
jgi:hypothetical protein